MYESYINKIEDVGKLRNLKPGTIRTYKNNVRDFLKFINKHPEDLTCEDARDFLLYLKDKGDKSSTLNNKNGSLVFFYKRVLGKLWDDNLVPRAINDYAIPRVLTREEVERLLDATPNLKYKAMFSLMYSSGLRVSEVIHLCRFISAIQKHSPLVMLFYPKELSTFLLSTGLSVASRKEFSFRISGQVNILLLQLLVWKCVNP